MVTTAPRPLAAASRFADRAAPAVVRALLVAAAGWLAFVLAVTATLAALAWALAAPAWVYVLVAALAFLLLAPAVGPLLTALSFVRAVRDGLRRAARAEERWIEARLPLDPRLRP